ncbi:MAG: histidinol-phosphatase [Oscillospiraceae bacterium]|nr:histidinol-phosphatase [Oscillospiraceae bacterium]
MIPCNYHTHTCFCDGKHTPEEMVQEALRLGCKEIGFSGHSYTPFDGSYCMTKENTLAYINAVRDLQKKYAEQIKIYLGIEQDYHSPESTAGYDYVIGSVHYVEKDGAYLSVDESKETQIAIVEQYYGGDFYSFVEDYYEAVSDVYNKTRCHIIGHFDLITKFNRERDLFDPDHPRYIAAARKALDALLDAPALLEVNTGAMSRGYTTEPYPTRDIISRWVSAGKEIIFSSDCHSKDHILFGYDVYETLKASL